MTNPTVKNMKGVKKTMKVLLDGFFFTPSTFFTVALIGLSDADVWMVERQK